MKTTIKIYYYFLIRIPRVVHDARRSRCFTETAKVYCITCVCIAGYRSSAELEAHYFVKSGHVFVENVENLLFAPYLFA